MTDDLAAWLRRQFDDEERDALPMSVAGPNPARWITISVTGGTLVEHARYDPARVLAEVAAKRAILNLHDPNDTTGKRRWCVGCIEPDLPGLMVRMPCQHVRLLAAPYASRPGYRNEWAPHAPTDRRQP